MAQPQRRPRRAVDLEQTIQEQTGVDVVAEELDGLITLSGLVESDDIRAEVLLLARELADGARIDDDLEVIDYLPDMVGETAATPLEEVSLDLPTAVMMLP